MRRMYSESELREFIRTHKDDVVSALAGKDISVEGITSKGIANTGGLANIGDVAISGNLDVQGEEKGEIIANKISQRQANWEVDLKSNLSSFFKNKDALYCKLSLVGNILMLVISGAFIANTDANTYHPLFTNLELDIPDTLASKIFRADGTSLNEAPSSEPATYKFYIATELGAKENPTRSYFYGALLSGARKQITMYVYNFGATTEDDEIYMNLRIPLLVL